MPEMNTIFSRRNAERRQHLLHLREDRVVAAAGAPADVLVAGEIGGLQDGKRQSTLMVAVLVDG